MYDPYLKTGDLSAGERIELASALAQHAADAVRTARRKYWRRAAAIDSLRITQKFGISRSTVIAYIRIDETFGTGAR